LALEIDFELISATEPSEPFCVVDEAAGTMNVRGQLLTARLVHLGTDDVVCEVKTTRAKERAVRMNTGDSRDKEMRPEVGVTKIEPVGGANLDGDLERMLRREIESALLPCYQRAICRNGRRQGALTMRVEIGADGVLSAPTVTVDALDSELISGCAMTTIADLTVPVEAAIPEFGVVVIFRIIEGTEGAPTSGWLPGVRAVGGSAIQGLEGSLR